MEKWGRIQSKGAGSILDARNTREQCTLPSTSVFRNLLIDFAFNAMYVAIGCACFDSIHEKVGFVLVDFARRLTQIFVVLCVLNTVHIPAECFDTVQCLLVLWLVFFLVYQILMSYCMVRAYNDALRLRDAYYVGDENTRPIDSAILESFHVGVYQCEGEGCQREELPDVCTDTESFDLEEQALLRNGTNGKKGEGEGGEASDCAICLVAYQAGDRIMTLSPCMHKLHEECVKAWFRAHDTCPICRHCFTNT